MQIEKPIFKPLLQKEKWNKLQINNYKSQLPSNNYSENLVRSLKFREVNGKKFILGEGKIGKVYLGDVRFQDGSKKRVAIKVLKFSKEYGYTEIIRRYKEIISELKNLKIPKGLLGNDKVIPVLPKCELIKLENGDFVFVSQAFTNEKKGKQETKFVRKSEIPVFQDLNYNKQILYTGAIVTSKGYVMTNDVFMRFKGRKDFILLDLDGLATNQKYKPEHRARAYINNILYNVLDNIKSPESKKELLEFTKKFIKEDKENIDYNFKSEILDLLNSVQI